MASSLNGATVPVSSKRSSYPGIDPVLQAASELVTKYTGDERIRSTALKITRSVRRHSATGQPDLRNTEAIARVIYTWMVRNINYVRDPWDVERIQSPDITLHQKAGDCDDHAILSAALLQSVGIQTGFRVVSRSGRSYDHIYTVYHSAEGWKSFDTTILKYPGYRFDERLIKKSKHVPNKMAEGMGDPFTIAAAIMGTVQGGMALKTTLSHVFAAEDKDEREHRGNLREYLMQQGVHSEPISVSHTQNHILERYVMIVNELGRPAVQYLNRYGNLPESFVAEERARNTKRKYGLYAGIVVGAVAITSAGIWAFKG
ncbi:MAG: transglutaminase-like domain-containing protein [Candidatus Babeliales bacterium]